MNIKKWLLNIGLIFSLEFILQFALFSTITIHILYIFLFSIVSGTIINLICNTFKSKTINNILSIFINFLITLIFLGQFVHYKFYHSIFSFYSLVNGGQVADFVDIIIKIILENIWFFILLFIPFVIFVLLNFMVKYKQRNIKHLFIEIIGVILLFIVTVLLLNFDKKDAYSSYNLYHNVHAPTFACQKLGLITTMRIDLQRIITGFEDSTIKINSIINKIPEVEYNTLNIDFDSLIKTEKNKEIIKLHNYFKSVEPTNKNDYTGIFKNKNLIVLTAEAFSPIAIDEKLTPTLYKLYKDSIHFNNFYTPIFYVSTSDGEYISLTSLLPKEGVWSMQESSKISLPYVYGNEFKKLGYTANAYHNGLYTYYKRNLSHSNMGYKFKGCGNGLEKKINCKIWPQSDVEMINATINDYVKKDKFVTYYMTISGHLNYNFYGNTMALRNQKYVKNLKYSDAVKAYLATNIELDKALETLIKQLEENNKLDDTVIVLSADHYPYGLTVNEMKEKADYITNNKFDIHKNNLIIWNNTFKKEINVDKAASSLDILPTVLNLFGVEYDSRLLMGSDLLSANSGLVIFNDRSWITDYGRYDALEKKYTKFKDIENEDEYIKRINAEVYNKFSVSRSILENNYYKYIK